MNLNSELFCKILETLKEEISLLPEDKLTKTYGDISNPPGNLVLHLCGNLNHNIGAVMSNNGYVRQRDLEFSRRDYTKNELLSLIDKTKETVIPLIEKLDLNAEFPSDFFGAGADNGSVLMRIAYHLGYHLGQINYFRRITHNK